MSLSPLVDEDTQAHELVWLLRAAGHDVLIVADAGLNAASDAQVFQHAVAAGRTLLTRNAADFLQIHQTCPQHPGDIAIYQDAAPGNAMSYPQIVRALDNLERSGLDLRGQFVVLNAWR